MPIEIRQEPLSSIVHEVSYLLKQHYLELTGNKDKVKLDPIWSRYAELEQTGKFYTFTVRDNGELVGYSGFILDRHLHYRDLMVATNDVLFLREDLRLGITGIRLIKFSENRMKELGANKITWHVKFSKDFRPILHRLGYLDEEVIVGKMF